MNNFSSSKPVFKGLSYLDIHASRKQSGIFRPQVGQAFLAEHMDHAFGAGDSLLVPDLCEPELANFEALRDEVQWHTMLHKGGPVPRLIAIQGSLLDDGSYPVYRHPAEQQPVLVSWTPLVASLRQAAERAAGHELNHALIQWHHYMFSARFIFPLFGFSMNL